MNIILRALLKGKLTILAVVTALTLALVSTALAGTGVGAPFNLGKLNTVNLVSKLVGSAEKAMLRVENTSTSPQATALNLTVKPNHTPMTVNSDVKVDLLNADKIDGQDSSAFLPAGGKAADSDSVDGIDSTQFQRTVAQSGQLLSGQLAARYIVDNRNFTLAEASYPVPLPGGTPDPVLRYVPGAPTAECPGIGQAAPGVLCIYGYNTANINSVTFGGSISGNSKLYGFSLDVFPTAPTSSGYLLANWAYRVP
jgi:hypothetical protein